MPTPNTTPTQTQPQPSHESRFGSRYGSRSRAGAGSSSLEQGVVLSFSLRRPRSTVVGPCVNPASPPTFVCSLSLGCRCATGHHQCGKEPLEHLAARSVDSRELRGRARSAARGGTSRESTAQFDFNLISIKGTYISYMSPCFNSFSRCIVGIMHAMCARSVPVRPCGLAILLSCSLGSISK